MKDSQKEVFKAWIDGDTMQYSFNGELWYDCLDFGQSDTITLYVKDGTIYRIKPKQIVTTTCIERDFTYGLHATYSGALHTHNLKLTWSPDGKKLLKAEVI